MSTELSTKNASPIVNLFRNDSVTKKFEEILGKKAPGFISGVLQVTQSNKLLAKADPKTILNSALIAASLDLPINQSLGFSWIVPYKGQAQFQIGWKGLVQLALRTGQYKRINVINVFENQFKSFNVLTEDLDADFSIDGDGEIVGYAAYFSLTNGFEKLSYWSKDQVIKHAKKYSQSFNSSYSPWSDKDQFHAMAQKTVLKNTISKYGIMSIEMQTAHNADQAVVSDEQEFDYVDNTRTIDITENDEKELNERVKHFISEATSEEQLMEVEGSLNHLTQPIYDEKMNELVFANATKEK